MVRFFIQISEKVVLNGGMNGGMNGAAACFAAYQAEFQAAPRV